MRALFSLTAFKKRSLSGRRLSVLRMAPMIDVVFLLLIFFLVAAKYRPAEDFLALKLPAAHARLPAGIKPEPLIIQINAAQAGCYVLIGHNRKIRIENQNLERDLAAFLEKLNNCLLAQKRTLDDPV